MNFTIAIAEVVLFAMILCDVFMVLALTRHAIQQFQFTRTLVISCLYAAVRVILNVQLCGDEAKEEQNHEDYNVASFPFFGVLQTSWLVLWASREHYSRGAEI